MLRGEGNRWDEHSQSLTDSLDTSVALAAGKGERTHSCTASSMRLVVAHFLVLFRMTIRTVEGTARSRQSQLLVNCYLSMSY